MGNVSSRASCSGPPEKFSTHSHLGRMLVVAGAGPQANARQLELRVWASENSCKGGGGVRQTRRAGRKPACFPGETFWVSLV